jgi:hypothetical protein
MEVAEQSKRDSQSDPDHSDWNEEVGQGAIGQPQDHRHVDDSPHGDGEEKRLDLLTLDRSRSSESDRYC